MPQATFRYDEDLEELIEQEQEKLPYNVTKSEIIRTALKQHLSGNATVETARSD